MHFYYVVLAAAVTLVASTSAVAEAQQNQISQTVPELEARSLRSRYVEEDSLDSLDSLDGAEERGGGFQFRDLAKLAKSNNKNLPGIIAKLSKKQQNKLVKIWNRQTQTLETVAQKLGMKSINDVKNRNYPVFQKFENLIMKPRTS